MKITLPHYTTQQEAIKKIDDSLNELMKQKFHGVDIIDPEKNWDGNIMRFSFTVQRLFLTLDFAGTVIVTNQEVIGEGDVPPIVTTFFSEDKIRKTIKEKFNDIFNINPIPL